MSKILTLCLFALSMFIASAGHAQINDKIYGDPENFSDLKNRILAVELLEENPEVIAKLSKKEKTAPQLDEYKNFIKKYNQLIKEAVTKYWKINKKTEFKTKAEADALRSAKNTQYALLSYTELGDRDVDVIERSPLVIPALIYYRPAKKLSTPDYKFCLPSSYLRKDVIYLESDFKSALQCMQLHINYCIDNNKTVDFIDYAKKMVKENCGKLQSLNMLVDEIYLYRSVSPDEASAAYGNPIKITKAQEIDKSYTEGKRGEAVLFCLPYDIGKGSVGPISGSGLMFIKLVMDSETGTIVGMYKGSAGIPTLLKGNFKNLKDCD